MQTPKTSTVEITFAPRGEKVELHFKSEERAREIFRLLTQFDHQTASPPVTFNDDYDRGVNFEPRLIERLTLMIGQSEMQCSSDMQMESQSFQEHAQREFASKFPNAVRQVPAPPGMDVVGDPRKQN